MIFDDDSDDEIIDHELVPCVYTIGQNCKNESDKNLKNLKELRRIQKVLKTRKRNEEKMLKKQAKIDEKVEAKKIKDRIKKEHAAQVLANRKSKKSSAEKKNNDKLAKIRSNLLNLKNQFFLSGCSKMFISSVEVGDTESVMNKIAHMLPIKNGKKLDLKTLRISKRTKGDMFNMELPVSYKPVVDPIVNTYFNNLCLNDKDYIESFRLYLGYSMTGEISDRRMAIWWGSGMNGKTLTMTILKSIMGNLYKTMESEALMSSARRAGQASPDLVPLATARIAVINETNEGDTFNSKLIKSATGGDEISYRPMYGSQLEMQTQAKVLAITNIGIKLDITDPAMIERVLMFPFNAKFTKTLAGIQLAQDVITKYRDDFFSYFATGSRDWYRTKTIPTCDVMKAGFNKYIKDIDIVGQFIEENYTAVSVSEYKSAKKNDKKDLRIKRTAFYAFFCAEVKENKPSKASFYKRADSLLKQVNLSNAKYYLCKTIGSGEEISDLVLD